MGIKSKEIIWNITLIFKMYECNLKFIIFHNFLQSFQKFQHIPLGTQLG